MALLVQGLTKENKQQVIDRQVATQNISTLHSVDAFIITDITTPYHIIIPHRTKKSTALYQIEGSAKVIAGCIAFSGGTLACNELFRMRTMTLG